MKNRLTFLSHSICLFTAVTALFFLLCGCQTIKQFIPNDEVSRFGTDRKYPDLNYTGDGNFTDYGRKAGILRFVLDLGAVNLTEASVSKFELKGLPKVEFVCYLRIDHPLPTIGKPKDFEAGDLVVEMSLEDEKGTKVFSEKAPLKNWVWSGSVGASQSDLYTRKTIFTPMKGKSYRLSLRVSECNLGASKARLILMGGGWKAF
ncbi:MAG: hypothetical protein HOH60_06260 [Opitutae bacterium]|jgi:hypothetical protein|nr:hypothetical protein [Opitutae bacterium]MBT7404675.1 hypothetical protein [Opitutae bacterium]